MVGEKSLKKTLLLQIVLCERLKKSTKKLLFLLRKKKLQNIFQSCNIFKDFSLLSPGYVFYCFWFSKKSLSSSSILADLLILLLLLEPPPTACAQMWETTITVLHDIESKCVFNWWKLLCYKKSITFTITKTQHM